MSRKTSPLRHPVQKPFAYSRKVVHSGLKKAKRAYQQVIQPSLRRTPFEQETLAAAMRLCSNNSPESLTHLLHCLGLHVCDMQVLDASKLLHCCCCTAVVALLAAWQGLTRQVCVQGLAAYQHYRRDLLKKRLLIKA